MSLNTAATGRSYEGEPFEVTQNAAMFYALAVGDRCDAYFDARRLNGLVVPPLYAAVYARGPVRAALLDPALGMRYEQLFLFDQSFQWLEPVRPGEVITTRATVKDINIYERGGLVTIETVSTNPKGKDVLIGRWGYFDRSAGKPGKGRPAKSGLPIGPVDLEIRVDIPASQTSVYAAAAGDRNPLHLDVSHAVGRGLKGIIVHGFNLMAVCAREIIAHLCAGDPSRLTSLSSRFVRPVYPGELLTVKAHRAARVDVDAGSTFDVSVLNPDDKVVITDASCVVKRGAS